jgi:hypothetical protein
MKTRLFSILFLGLLLLLTALNFTKCNKANGDSTNISTSFGPTIEYGIVTDSFQVTRGIIKPGQVLGEILYRADSEMEKIVKTTIYLKNMDDFSYVNDVYSSFFSESVPLQH